MPSRTLPNLWVGLIEEAVKATGLLLVGRGLARYRVRDGIILGARPGLGGAAAIGVWLVRRRWRVVE